MPYKTQDPEQGFILNSRTRNYLHLDRPSLDKPSATSFRSLLVGAGLVHVSNGLIGILIAVRAENEGFGLGVTGFIMGAYYVGFLLGTKLAEHFLVTVGHIRLFAGFVSLASSTALLYAMWINPVAWGLLRMVFGMCISGIVVTSESWINGASSNTVRGRLMGIYISVVLGGICVGQFLINSADTSDHTLFVVSSILLSLALLPVSLSNVEAPPSLEPKPMRLRSLIKQSPLGTVTVFWVGVSHGIVLGLGALYAATEGLSAGKVSLFMSATLIGGALLQRPIGAISDRIPRRIVIFVVAVAAVVTACLNIATHPGSSLSIMLMFIHGGCTFPLYSLAVAMTVDSTPTNQIHASCASLSRIVSVGAILGPVIGGWVMASTIPLAFFMMLAASNAVIVAYTAYRILVHEAIPVSESSKFMWWSAKTSITAINPHRSPRQE